MRFKALLIFVTFFGVLGLSYYAFIYSKNQSTKVGNLLKVVTKEIVLGDQEKSAVEISVPGKGIRRVVLISKNEKKSIVDVNTQYCGAPNVGANVFKGSFILKVDGFAQSLDLKTLQFVQGTTHDGTLYSDGDLILLYTYLGCQNENLSVFGLEPSADTLFRYKFVSLDGTISQNVCISPRQALTKQLTKDQSGDYVVGCVNVDTEKEEYSFWKIDTSEQAFVQTK